MKLSDLLGKLFGARVAPARGEAFDDPEAEAEGRDVDPFDPFPEPVRLEIGDVFDLHTIPPREVRAVVEEYLREARRKGFRQVRIIHGKGVGNLRRTVHAILSKHPDVLSFTLDHPQLGGWGATIIYLRKPAA